MATDRLGYSVPNCPHCDSPPAADGNLDDVCPKCGTYTFYSNIVELRPLGRDISEKGGNGLFPDPVYQRRAAPYWRQLPPSQVHPPAEPPREWIPAKEAVTLAKAYGAALTLPQINKLSTKTPPSFITRRVGGNRREVDAVSFLRYLKSLPKRDPVNEDEDDGEEKRAAIERRMAEEHKKKARGRSID